MSQRSSRGADPPLAQSGGAVAIGEHLLRPAPPPAADPADDAGEMAMEGPDKLPKTARGRRTRERILEAASTEFGDRGFHDASISGITTRAGVALGTFYVYFDSKEALFRALVGHTNRLTRSWIAERVKDAPDRLSAERLGLAAFVEFIRTHKSIYRIVMESQFVAPDAYADYYQTFAVAYERNLRGAAERGEISPGANAARAWALIGISVFVGLKYGVWDDQVPMDEVIAAVGDLIDRGLAP